MEQTKTFKGAEAVNHGGFTYRKAYSKADGSAVYRCRKKNGKDCCTGRVEITSTQNFIITKNHWLTCMPDELEVEVKRRKVDMKDAVDAAPTTSTRTVYQEGLLGAGDSVKVSMTPISQQRCIDRWKAKHVPGAPQTIADLQLPESFSTTISGQRCFYHFVSEDKFLIIFGTDRDLMRLANGNMWLGDGFHSIPLYQQVYVIGVMDDGIFLPCIYALCKNKNESTYV